MSRAKFSIVFAVMVFFIPKVCDAGLNELIVDKTQEITKEMGFSDQFLENLKDCKPFQEGRSYNGIEAVYEIKGRDEDGNCIIVSNGNHEKIQVVSTCKFDKDILDLFYHSQVEVRKLIANASSVEEIIGNENYLLAGGLMMNDELCRNERSEYDPTKELREKLAKCEPYQDVERTDRYEIIRDIDGRIGNVCRYTMQTITKAPKEEELRKLLGDETFESMKDTLLKDISMTTKCAFTPEGLQKYISLLEKTAIPSGDAYDLSYMDNLRESNKEAADFLLETEECKTYQ